MNKSSAKNKKHPTMLRAFKWFLLICVAIVLLVLCLLLLGNIKDYRQQSKLSNFYDTSGLELVGTPGELVRQAALNTPVNGGKGWRVLYRTQRFDGSYTFASGLVFVPSKYTGNNTRPVVAWAHGTLGMGDACAPSRTTTPPNTVPGLEEMLSQGWVVTATDYAGLGTPGTEGYLVGASEAKDVLNSVRAARNLGGSQAGSRFAVWGHSQGGHSALFTAKQSGSYAPELQLLGTVASAPAAELKPLLEQQYNNALGWVIGPEIMLSWPQVYTDLYPSAVLSSKGLQKYEKLAKQCIKTSALGGMIRNALKQQFFNVNPLSLPAWQDAINEQTAPSLQPTEPLMVVESTADQVVLPNTTARYIQKACQAGSNLFQLWLARVGHINLQTVAAPAVIGWLSDRFEAQPNNSNCSQPLPVNPATL